MKITLSLFRSFLGISAAAMLMFGCAEMQMDDGSSGSSSAGSSSAPASTVNTSNVAAGHFGDSLEACLDRIPSGSTDSQRMLAEFTCQRDADASKSIRAVPGK